MLRFAGVDELAAAGAGDVRWRRAVEAIRRAGALPPEVTRSIGDSLTYRLTSASDLPVLTGHRRYLEVRHVVSGRVLVEVGPVGALEPAGPYDDLSDSQPFTGSGTVVELGVGDTLVAGVEEAVRDVVVEGRVVVLRVTIEEG